MRRNCEICKQKEARDLINIGIDIGFHIGDYGRGQYEKHKVKPKTIGMFSIYLCGKCKSSIETKDYFNINIYQRLSGFIKNEIKMEFIKNLIIENLK
ncbi:hypothetical protein LCGC14_1472710 [marine sediment metagenome]|uniref:Uncharacterized protein n=1 Tax=marine sediment metagenome TaxID=412755 RepID=A0A0F9JCK6_9ZZZZ